MVTFFSTPKPFAGHVGDIQRNAIRSWAALQPACEVILFGDEKGTAEIAKEAGVQHVPEVARNRWGTPLLNALFGAARERSRREFLCYVNADIIIMSGFLDAATRIAAWRKQFLMVGRRINLDVVGAIDMARLDWQERLLAHAREKGVVDSSHAIDFFLFTRDAYPEVAPFAIGRFAWDNWLIYSALSRRIPVVDATAGVTIVHQNHDYSHVGHSKVSLWDSEEAQVNRSLAGPNLRTLDDTSHLFDGSKVRPNLSLLRFRRALARRAKAYTGREMTRATKSV